MIKLMIKRNIQPSGARVLCLGLTFKENCPDVRNTRVGDIVREFESFGAGVDIYDPWIDREEAEHEYGVKPLAAMPEPGAGYDAVVLAVAHQQFKDLGAAALRRLGHENCVLFDVKYALPKDAVDGRL
jgi:UDP-N-acetyl-D-galactosamine dehydrogenase